MNRALVDDALFQVLYDGAFGGRHHELIILQRLVLIDLIDGEEISSSSNGRLMTIDEGYITESKF